MISAELFCDELAERGFGLASGVPCSFFGGPIALLGDRPGAYVPAANEGAALAVAAGAALAGRRAYVMLQNSGLGNLINPLTSLVMTYRIPLLTFVSLRGWPDPARDEPQHAVMGPTTEPYLELLELPHWTLRSDDGPERFRDILDAALEELTAGRSPFVLIEKGAIAKAGGSERPGGGEDRLDSAEAVRLIAKLVGDAAVIATTGYTGRELFGIDDRPANFYMQGSMGHASSLALGVALARPERTVVVLDGDGAALMHLGALSTVGAQGPPNLIHVVLDNGAHESTGGQPTTSATTRLEDVADAAGYRSHRRCRTLADVQEAIAEALVRPGPHMCVIPTRRRTGPMPPRATNTHPPESMRDRFTNALDRPSGSTAQE
ncbi:phosphonopyruvate decarboxylase [Thermomonospora umbrina]|uniref:Phosphonopyruvate decarboxylase n=1 Tax=Thermomonospora umbrina TaxID=111806 RepID=A0A3D9SZD6_9ACTN|nr:phosphonopyruvate decarboxylase [Thermomonospora umbrina]REE99930.1 phosphonopyruvate decarboxylase [Thermomonospora umbrina]